MKLEKLAGATSEIWQVFIRDSSSTTGGGLTGLAFNTASLTAYYHRDTDTTATAITLATMTVGTFTSSGFKEIDATNMPGWYQFCPPNAAIAAGAKSCAFHLKGATNMAPLPIEVQLTAINPDSATAFMTSVATVTTLTNLPSIPANWLTAAGINAAALNGKGDWSTVTPTNLTAAQIATGIFQDATAGDFTVAGSIGKSIMNGVALGTGLTVNDLTTKTGYALTAAYDFAKGTVAMTESYAANTVAPTPIQALYAIQQHLQDFAIAGTSYTVFKLDHVTTAFIGTLDSAVTPTSQVRT